MPKLLFYLMSLETILENYCYLLGDNELTRFPVLKVNIAVCKITLLQSHAAIVAELFTGFPRVLISGKSPYFQLLPSRPWKSPYFWIFSIEVREKSWFSIAVTKPRWSTSSCASWGFSKCCGNDVELFGNPSDPLTNHRWRMVWRHLVPAKIPRASFIKFYYVATESQSADTWCHVVVVRNLIGPHSRRYTWRTLCKTSSIFVEIRQHT